MRCRWPLLALLCAAASAQHKFQRLPDVLAATPSATLETISHMACSTFCSRSTYSECAAYSFAANGTCWLFPAVCLRTEPSADHPGVVSYTKPPQPTRWCPADGVVLDNRCYTRHVSDHLLTWYAAQEACRVQNACYQLATPGNVGPFRALLYLNRPNAYEWIGAEDLDGDGVITNIDGSNSNWQPPMYSWASKGAILLPDRYLLEIHRTSVVSGNVRHYVCESDLHCSIGKPCPDGWVLLQEFCYQYVRESRTWHDARAYCTTLGPNGQLASPSSNGVWQVLWKRLLGDATTSVFMGAYDFGHEGTWLTLDGGPIGVHWHANEPSNAGSNEHCLEMVGDRANDIPCEFARYHICRIDAQLC